MQGGAGKLSLARIEGVAIERADGREADVARPGFRPESFRGRAPVFLAGGGKTLIEPHPGNGAETVLLCPVEDLDLRISGESNSHSPPR